VDLGLLCEVPRSHSHAHTHTPSRTPLATLSYSVNNNNNNNYYYYYYYVVVVVVVVSGHMPFLPGTSLEPAVTPTAQASSSTLQYFPYYV
jgi:hypothetical protein